ncbi:CotH kinase family protein [Saprospiraceae bacterium]|nr:CotH kinase family protein [Saprospiraceae bacterium]
MMKNTFRLYTVILAILISFLAVGQGGLVFDDSYVHEVRITIDNVDFWSELSQNYQNNYPDVPYTMAIASIDGEVTDSVGIRQKGFASHFGSQGDKKSMKIDFNHFVDGKKYDGLNKINLNNGYGDPAIQRDKLCYNIMNKAGVDAPRTSYARIYLNDQYWGLYLLVEQVDGTFLKDNFGNSNGNLFKNVGNSELEWMGQDTSQYQQIFELKTDPNVEAWENFAELMDVLNNTGDGDFKEEISKIFDVDLYLKVLAVDVATGNWDSYIEHGRNFYMYQDADSRKFNWIPWDYNFALGGTFGSDFGGPGGGGPDEGNPNGNTLSEFPVDMSNSEKVLVNRLLAVPEYKERYYQGFCRLLDDNFTTERIFPLIEQYGDLVREDVLEDPNYEWTAEHFEADLDQGDQISGLKWVFEGQVASLTAQLNELFDCSSIITTLSPLDVSINEFMAVNDSLSTIKDPAGETDDWIELYNNTDADIDLSNAFLSDNSDNPEKWQFPVGTTIRANDYLIIWADKDEDQEGLHADFKLNRDGDFIMLTEGTDVIDSLTFGFQENNLTYSRIPNGTGDYLIKDPTFGYNNEQETAVIDEYVGEIKVYPNPATQYIDVDLEKLPKAGAKVTLTNGIGQTLFTTKMSSRFTRIDLNNLNGGIFLVTIQDEKSRTIKTEKVIVFK